MRRTSLIGLGLLVTASMLTGCNNDLKDENALLTEENHNLREQLSERNTALDSAHDELREKDMQLARLRGDLEESRNSVTMGDPFGDIQGVKGSVGAGEITATVESDVLFASGKATLRSSAKQSLNQVARIITSQYPGRSVRVAGHTDSDPIRKSGYKSNYHLGFERAYAVRDYLISQGVSSSQVYIASHGPDRTMGSKKESRRVDIVVVLNE